MSNAFHLFIILILSNHSPKIIEMIKTDRWIWKTFDDPHDFISRHQPSSKIHQIFSDHKYSNEWAVCHRVQEAPWPFPVRANKKADWCFSCGMKCRCDWFPCWPSTLLPLNGEPHKSCNRYRHTFMECKMHSKHGTTIKCYYRTPSRASRVPWRCIQWISRN